MLDASMIAALQAEMARRDSAGLPQLEGPALAQFLESRGDLTRKDFATKRARKDHYSTQALFTDHLVDVREAIQNAYTLAGDTLSANELAYQVVYVVDMTRDADGKSVAIVSAPKFKDHVGKATRASDVKDAPEDALLRWIDGAGTMFESRADFLHSLGRTISDDVILRPCKVGKLDRLAKVWLDSDGTPNADSLAAALAKLAERFS